jgi:lipid-binding SYLF domain-containing protein
LPRKFLLSAVKDAYRNGYRESPNELAPVRISTGATKTNDNGGKEMRKHISALTCLLASLTLLVALAVVPALAGEKDDAILKVDEASVVVQKMIGAEDKGVARSLLKKAKAVAIFPSVFKAGFIIGGQGGTGVILARSKDGSWSGPAFYTMAGASVGLQIGASSTDFMMMIMTANGLKGILEGHAKLGGDATVAAGPVGRSATGGSTFAGKDSDIYSYSMSAPGVRQGAHQGLLRQGLHRQADPGGAQGRDSRIGQEAHRPVGQVRQVRSAVAFTSPRPRPGAFYWPDGNEKNVGKAGKALAGWVERSETQRL